MEKKREPVIPIPRRRKLAETCYRMLMSRFGSRFSNPPRRGLPLEFLLRRPDSRLERFLTRNREPLVRDDTVHGDIVAKRSVRRREMADTSGIIDVGRVTCLFLFGCVKFRRACHRYLSAGSRYVDF